MNLVFKRPISSPSLVDQGSPEMSQDKKVLGNNIPIDRNKEWTTEMQQTLTRMMNSNHSFIHSLIHCLLSVCQDLSCEIVSAEVTTTSLTNKGKIPYRKFITPPSSTGTNLTRGCFLCSNFAVLKKIVHDITWQLGKFVAFLSSQKGRSELHAPQEKISLSGCVCVFYKSLLNSFVPPEVRCGKVKTYKNVSFKEKAS